MERRDPALMTHLTVFRTNFVLSEVEKSGQSAIELLGNVLVAIKNKKLAEVGNAKVCFGLEVGDLTTYGLGRPILRRSDSENSRHLREILSNSGALSFKKHSNNSQSLRHLKNRRVSYVIFKDLRENTNNLIR